MSDKAMYTFGAFIGSIIGAYIPEIFHASLFSGWSILTSAFGGFLGIYLVYKWING